MSHSSGIFLTSLKASLSSFTPIMSAVSARSLGPISSTKSSKSTCPPTVRKQELTSNPHHMPRKFTKLWCKAEDKPVLDFTSEGNETKNSYGSCWSADSVLSAPSLLACIPSSACSSPSPCSQWIRLYLCQTPWMLHATLGTKNTS